MQIVTPPLPEHLFYDRTYVRLYGHPNTRSASEHPFGHHRARRNPQPVGVGGPSWERDRRLAEHHQDHHQHADD